MAISARKAGQEPPLKQLMTDGNGSIVTGRCGHRSICSGLFDSAEFLMSGGNARLLIKVAEHSDIILQFKRVRWHEFTALYNCSAEQVKSAYFKLVRLDESELLTKYIVADRAVAKAYKDGPIGCQAKNGQESPSWKESEELRESIPSELIYTRPSRSPRRREYGNHTDHFLKPPRVTVRVNAGAG